MFVAVFRKTSDDIEYLVFSCNSDPEDLRKGSDEDCADDDVVFNAATPFLPDDRVMVSLAINNQE